MDVQTPRFSRNTGVQWLYLPTLCGCLVTMFFTQYKRSVAIPAHTLWVSSDHVFSHSTSVQWLYLPAPCGCPVTMFITQCRRSVTIPARILWVSSHHVYHTMQAFSDYTCPHLVGVQSPCFSHNTSVQWLYLPTPCGCLITMFFTQHKRSVTIPPRTLWVSSRHVFARNTGVQ